MSKSRIQLKKEKIQKLFELESPVILEEDVNQGKTAITPFSSEQDKFLQKLKDSYLYFHLIDAELKTILVDTDDLDNYLKFLEEQNDQQKQKENPSLLFTDTQSREYVQDIDADHSDLDLDSIVAEDGKSHDEAVKIITFKNTNDKKKFVNLAKDIENQYYENEFEPSKVMILAKDGWENFLLALKLRKEYQDNSSSKIKISVYEDIDNPDLIRITFPLDNNFNDEIKERIPSYSIYTSSDGTIKDKLLITTFKSSLNEFLKPYSEISFWERIDNRIRYYEKNKKSMFATESYINLWDHKISMLKDTKKFLINYLKEFHESTNNVEKVIKELHENEHTYHRWVEGPVTRKLVEEAKELAGIPREIIALDTRIAERINEYKKNRDNEYDALIYTNESKLELWKHKRKVLKAAQEVLYADKHTLADKLEKLEKAENENYRWIEGSETPTLVRDIKKIKGVDNIVIALDTRIARQIIICEEDIRSTGNYIMGLFGQDSSQLWKDEIKVLKAAKAALYDKRNEQDFIDALNNGPRLASDIKAITDAVTKFTEKRSKKIEKPDMNEARNSLRDSI